MSLRGWPLIQLLEDAGVGLKRPTRMARKIAIKLRLEDSVYLDDNSVARRVWDLKQRNAQAR